MGEQAAALHELMHGSVVHAPLADPVRILDVGCGTGFVTIDLALRYPDAEVYGVDISAVPIRDHSSIPPNVHFIQGDIRSLVADAKPPLTLGSFDHVFSRLLIMGVDDGPS